MVAPTIFRFARSTTMRTYLPNRLELSLRTVFALPKASKIGLQLKILSSILIAAELLSYYYYNYYFFYY